MPHVLISGCSTQAAQEAQQLQKDLLTNVGDLTPVLAVPAAFQDPSDVCEPLHKSDTPTGVFRSHDSISLAMALAVYARSPNLLVESSGTHAMHRVCSRCLLPGLNSM